MEEFEQEDGISLLDIIKLMFSRKLLLLIITVSIGLVGTIAILFGVNNIRSKYVSEFRYSDQNLNDGKYIDGAVFNYGELLTSSNLVRIKASNSKFDSIDITKLIESNGISINRTVEEKDNVITDIYYSIVAEKKYFSSKNQAKEFIEAIANTALENNTNKVKYLDYDTNLTSFKSATTLDSKVRFLKSQYEFIETSYDNLMSLYNNCVIQSKNKSLAAYVSEFKNAFSLQNSVDTLYGNLLKNAYVLDYDNRIEEYEAIYNTYLSLYESKNSKINELKTLINDTIQTIPDAKLTRYYEEIIKTSNEKRECQEMAIYYANVLGKIDPSDPTYVERATQAESEEFDKDVIAVKNKLVEYTNVLKDVETEILTDNNNVYYSKTNVIYVTENINFIIAVAASLVIGFVVGCITNVILDHNKLTNKPSKKEEDAE